jgi:hypothetical protein
LEIPVTVYYKNRDVVKATAGIPSKMKITAIVENEFTETVTA